MKNIHTTSKWNEYIETPFQRSDSKSFPKIDMGRFAADDVIELPKRLPEESFRSYINRVFV